MKLMVGMIIAAVAALVLLFLRSLATSVRLPSNPDTFVPSELQTLVDWLAQQAQEQTGHPIARNPLARSALAEAARQALEDADPESGVEISLPQLVHDAEGPKGFKVTVSREELTRFGIRSRAAA